MAGSLTHEFRVGDKVLWVTAPQRNAYGFIQRIFAITATVRFYVSVSIDGFNWKTRDVPLEDLELDPLQSVGGDI